MPSMTPSAVPSTTCCTSPSRGVPVHIMLSMVDMLIVWTGQDMPIRAATTACNDSLVLLSVEGPMLQMARICGVAHMTSWSCGTHWCHTEVYTEWTKCCGSSDPILQNTEARGGAGFVSPAAAVHSMQDIKQHSAWVSKIAPAAEAVATAA